MQVFYDGLSPASKLLFDEYMNFIVGKEHDAKKHQEAAERALYASQAQRYEEMFIRASAADGKASDTLLFGSDGEIRAAFRKFVWGALEDGRDDEIKAFPHEWVKSYCSAVTPRLDLHVDENGHVRGEDEEIRAEVSELLALAIDRKAKKLADRYEEVMEKVMEAYDSAHGLT